MISLMREQVRKAPGFIAALDQSGGSTPKALKAYGIAPDAYGSDAQMYDLIHQMRCRIMQTPGFDAKKVIGAILFERTMESQVEGLPVAQYLWREKNVVPFLKIDQGLVESNNGVQLMKPIDGLESLLNRAVLADVFGTKMRSVIHQANASGIQAVVEQQFAIGDAILDKGLTPIIEPEISIVQANKLASEKILRDTLMAALDRLGPGLEVMLKLTLPEQSNFYKPLVDHPKVLRVVALSGGYSREESNKRLTANSGVIASFSRALTQGLTAQQSAAEFKAALGSAIEEIAQASAT